VIVPQDFHDQPQLVLQIGTHLPVPIRDLRVDADGVYGTLSFNRSPFTCTVPWSAVFALVGDDGRGTVWPGSMPKEIAAEVKREAERARIAAVRQDEDERQQPRRARPAPGPGGNGKSKLKLPPYLRVVK
jgi:stringent starvation protein B